jgi:outer membrane protein insertion porin family
LRSILNIKKGDVYNKKVLDSRLYMNQSGRDISSLYMDDGYLSFYPDPVELLVEGDSIDLDIRIREGKQYRIRNVIIKGNSKTNEHVIRREIRTKPGAAVQPQRCDPHPAGTEPPGLLQPREPRREPHPGPAHRHGGPGVHRGGEAQRPPGIERRLGSGRVVLSLGLSFTNFSLRKTFNKQVLATPARGDGQTLNLRRTDQRPLLPKLQHELRGALAGWSQGRMRSASRSYPLRADQRRGRFIDSDDGRIPTRTANPCSSAVPPSAWASA